MIESQSQSGGLDALLSDNTPPVASMSVGSPVDPLRIHTAFFEKEINGSGSGKRYGLLLRSYHHEAAEMDKV